MSGGTNPPSFGGSEPMRPAVPILIAALALSACEPASPLVDRSGIQEAFAEDVRGCTPLSTITTTTGVSGSLLGPRTMEIARNETKEKAAAAGADTVVWVNGGPGTDDVFVEAATYRCK